MSRSARPRRWMSSRVSQASTMVGDQGGDRVKDGRDGSGVGRQREERSARRKEQEQGDQEQASRFHKRRGRRRRIPVQEEWRCACGGGGCWRQTTRQLIKNGNSSTRPPTPSTPRPLLSRRGPRLRVGPQPGGREGGGRHPAVRRPPRLPAAEGAPPQHRHGPQRPSAEPGLAGYPLPRRRLANTLNAAAGVQQRAHPPGRAQTAAPVNVGPAAARGGGRQRGRNPRHRQPQRQQEEGHRDSPPPVTIPRARPRQRGTPARRGRHVGGCGGAVLDGRPTGGRVWRHGASLCAAGGGCGGGGAAAAALQQPTPGGEDTMARWGPPPAGKEWGADAVRA